VAGELSEGAPAFWKMAADIKDPAVASMVVEAAADSRRIHIHTLCGETEKSAMQKVVPARAEAEIPLGDGNGPVPDISSLLAGAAPSLVDGSPNLLDDLFPAGDGKSDMRADRKEHAQFSEEVKPED
jgi:hypothetical protein